MGGEEAGQRRRRYYRLTPGGRGVLPRQRSIWGTFFAALKSIAGIRQADGNGGLAAARESRALKVSVSDFVRFGPSPVTRPSTIVTIALGVGAVTTLFSVANGVLLRPLPWPEAERLVRVTESRGGRQGRIPGTMMNGTYLAWADSPQTIEGIGAWRTATVDADRRRRRDAPG